MGSNKESIGVLELLHLVDLHFSLNHCLFVVDCVVDVLSVQVVASSEEGRVVVRTTQDQGSDHVLDSLDLWVVLVVNIVGAPAVWGFFSVTRESNCVIILREEYNNVVGCCVLKQPSRSRVNVIVDSTTQKATVEINEQ